MVPVKKNRWVLVQDGRIIEPTRDTYEADPFILDGVIFFELYDYNKGVIAIKNKEGKNEVVLERPYHLSFPCVFEDNGEYYMLPETVNNRQLELYKAKNFPYNWELVKVIKEGWYDDPILYKDKNGYYIYTTEGENNLRIFRADELQGEWNQVYSDSSKQYRSAGKIFERDGKLIRPCQDCEKGYGGGIIFYELDGYNHKEISKFNLPEPFTGTHTYNEGLIDARFKYDTEIHSFEDARGIRLDASIQRWQTLG